MFNVSISQKYSAKYFPIYFAILVADVRCSNQQPSHTILVRTNDPVVVAQGREGFCNPVVITRMVVSFICRACQFVKAVAFFLIYKYFCEGNTEIHFQLVRATLL